MSENSNVSVLPQPLVGAGGYEVRSPAGLLLGMVEARFVVAVIGAGMTVAVERIAQPMDAPGIERARFPLVLSGGRPVIEASQSEIGALAGFVPRGRLDLWALFRARLHALRRPVVRSSDGARHLDELIEEVRVLAAESRGLSPGRFALLDLAWQRMRMFHDPELAAVRLADALRPGPDILRRA